ncbi:DUF5682 family protein [Actinacidiphila guanduensis]|uniref:Uncharacterized protein n=1 Tax=Actinacidiphila guanduensis TaxID=310781 RepID=A0A1H0JA94_9ACTN|nr:DUF5682 family protein [Actinacidiphila guanduensis]SDO40470.1 hypothetical protein SAMN05216259_109298 [Actinacidiphila guanduensis]
MTPPADSPAGAASGGTAPARGGPEDLLLLGVRHHGPGSARAVRAALDAYRPQAVLIEGPPEADALTALAADPAMRPPVALLAHVTDDPARAAFWPFAEFSPEWVAMRWAAEANAEVRFIDLPAAHTLALREAEAAAEEATGEAARGREEEGGPGPAAATPTDAPADGRRGSAGQGPEGARVEGAEEEGDADSGSTAPGSASPEEGAPAGGGPGEGLPGGGPGEEPAAAALRVDPIAVLAEAAGYADPERWWEDAVEHRGSGDHDPYGPFAALAEAMGEIRAAYGDGGDPRDPLREAHMRLRIREARRAHERTAVVCGAWHVPALAARSAAAADRALLKGLPKAKVETTWVPWTHRRLARAGGYGAGIDSPGWYQHLFSAPDRPVTRWMTKIAGLLREEDLPVSSAHVIEAVRLADTLATVRGRPLAGLGETIDAVRAVMCDGSDVPLALIRDQLVVGDALGEVPPDAPAVPLARDLAREQRRLRLKPEAQERELELDLRKDTDTARSRLLHRLRLIGVPWGEPAAGRSGTGTFRETWRLRWEPELSVRIAEAGIWGTTVAAAAGARAQDLAQGAATLAEVTSVAERCLLAGLGEALPEVMRLLADRAALDADVAHLAAALPALVRAVRYGDVRGTDSAALARVASGLAERICVGFPPACVGLDADGAAALRVHLDEVHRAVALLDKPLRDRWAAMLGALARRDEAVPGLLRGAAARLLLDEGRLDAEEAARLMGLALSPGTGPAQAAGWVEGFLAGGGMLLVHDERLLALVDGWLSEVPAEAFTDVLPLLRRTFAQFEPGVLRSLGDLVRRGPAAARRPAPATGDSGLPGFGPGLDVARANAAAGTVRLLLGRRTTAGLADLRHPPAAQDPAQDPDGRASGHRDALAQAATAGPAAPANALAYAARSTARGRLAPQPAAHPSHAPARTAAATATAPRTLRPAHPDRSPADD